jgi:hypothetical protein
VILNKRMVTRAVVFIVCRRSPGNT